MKKSVLVKVLTAIAACVALGSSPQNAFAQRGGHGGGGGFHGGGCMGFHGGSVGGFHSGGHHGYSDCQGCAPEVCGAQPVNAFVQILLPLLCRTLSMSSSTEFTRLLDFGPK
jgi:hypothetical protein